MGRKGGVGTDSVCAFWKSGKLARRNFSSTQQKTYTNAVEKMVHEHNIFEVNQRTGRESSSSEIASSDVDSGEHAFRLGCVERETSGMSSILKSLFCCTSSIRPRPLYE